MQQGEFVFASPAGTASVLWKEVTQSPTPPPGSPARLPLHQRVRVKLRDFDRPFEGCLVVSDRSTGSSAVRYQLATLPFDFGPDEIESCVVL